MTVGCPDCGRAAPPAVAPGTVYACPGCRNPVLAREAPTPAPATATPPPDAAPAPPTRRTVIVWALVASCALFAAYAGAYELLTAESKRERAALERAHGAGLLVAPSPGPRPTGDAPAELKAWLATRDAHEARLRHEALSKRIGWFFTAMLAAFGAQVALTAWIVVRTRRAIDRRG